MELYHGSIVIVDQPKIIPSEIGRDFGHGFYTTSIKDQALKWSRRKARIDQSRRLSSQPVLNIYEMDWQSAIELLKVKDFGHSVSMEWLEFVVQCRQNNDFFHGYDIVVGNIADDNVGETISYVQRGIMRKEDALERLQFEKINNQICFNTPQSLDFLRFARAEVVPL
jgi:hypothetical protein